MKFAISSHLLDSNASFPYSSESCHKINTECIQLDEKHVRPQLVHMFSYTSLHVSHIFVLEFEFNGLRHDTRASPLVEIYQALSSEDARALLQGLSFLLEGLLVGEGLEGGSRGET